MTGAAFLAGKACLRTGAGLVTIACPESANTVLEIKTTCVMTRPLPETAEGSLAEAALELLLGLKAGRQALAIGPGLSRHPETAAVVRSFLGSLGEGDPPVVVDADGLNAFEGCADLLSSLGDRAVLTPHPGEFLRLAQCDRAALSAERREETLRAFVERVGVVTMIKGYKTLVVDPQGRLYQNGTGNPGMASGGTGDVLTGIVAGLLGQGLDPFDAARLGAYLHGRAGECAARRTGWAPLIASDMLDGLIEAIRALEERS
jgi:NAD(P)H-hydrate epimerase